MQEGNIFVAAAGYRFLRVIAPTDEEFTVVDTITASHRPAKLSSSSNAAARTCEPGLSCRQRSAEIVGNAVSDFAPLAEVASSSVTALSRRSSSAMISGDAGDRENHPCALMAPSGKVAATR
jgi:hypothetical protein